MKAVLLFAALLLLLLAGVSSTVCNSTTFWNPLNNACVNQCPWQSPVLYYADTSTRQCVITCPTTPSLFANDFTQSCVNPCPYNSTIKTYYDNYYRRCVMNCPSSPSYYALDQTTSGSCVQYCPFGTFSLDSTRVCTASCPVYKFVNYTLNVVQYQCVARCPANTFLNSTNFCVNATSCTGNTFGSPYTGTCVAECPNNSTLQTYADTNPDVNLCVFVCPTRFYKQTVGTNSTCVATCQTNYLIDYVNLVCVQTCPSGSYAFSNGSCLLACPNGFFANPIMRICNTSCANSTFADSSSNFCVSMCPPGSFADVNANYTCVKTCMNGTYANPVSRTCVVKASCTTPFIYADDFSRQCVTLCPVSQNTYGDAANNYCTLNCPAVAQFRDPSTQTCVSRCPINPSLYADSTSNNCVPSCPTVSSTAYYAVDATRTCETSCPNNTYIDNVAGKCVSTCPTDPFPTFYYAVNTSSSQCLQYCPAGHLADPTTLTCINTQCPSLPALFGFNRTCIPICPSGTFANIDTRTCDTACNITNTTYLEDPSTMRCVTVCPANPKLFADWTTYKCVSLCPPGYFADNSTRTCVQVCNQSVGYLAYTPLRLCVLVCPNNTYAYNGTCISICPNTSAPFFYVDTTTKSCVSSCPDYYFKDDYLGQCVQVGGCSNGFYADYSIRACVQYCNSTLSTYRDTTTMSCVTQCPFGLYGDLSDPTQKKCSISCPNQWFTDNSTWTCVQVCPTNPSYYADTASGACMPACRAQLDLFAYDVTRRCVNPCPANTTADVYTRRCLPNCLLVPSTYLFVNGTQRVCLLRCPIGFFADNSTRNCVTNCPSSPNYYADWLSATCVSLCPWTSTTKYYADTLTRTCVAACPNATNTTVRTYRDTVLRICSAGCSGHQFSDNSTGKCVAVCPTTPDYFGQASNQSCVFTCNVSEPAWSENVTRLCVRVCPAGSYADNFTQRCVAKCTVSQLYYGDNSTHMCVTRCPTYPELYADNSTQTCVPICPGFTYAAPVTRVCEFAKNCSANYFADNFTKLCVTNCPATQGSYADSISRYCVRRCPVGSFADNSTYRCVAVCPDSPSYFGHQQRCLAACPVNTYADTPTRLCVASTLCTNNTWADPTSQQCVATCPFNFFADTRNTTKICVQLCPRGFYADDLTKTCVTICPVANFTYGTNATRRCVEVCPQNEFAENTTRMCMSNCPNNSFADSNVRVCVAVCSATPNLYGNPVNNTCVYTCPSTPDLYAENSSRLCLSACPFNQSTFADRLTRRCVFTCPVSGFTYADNYTRRCEVNCTYNTLAGVLTYADNSTLTCVGVCPSVPEYYADISTGTGKCVPYCPNNTSPRIYSDNSTRVCQLICNFSRFYYASGTNGQCVVVCPGGFFADNQTQTCVARCPGRIVVNPTTAIDTFGYQLARTCVNFCVGVFFAQNSSRLCVLNCPQLEYADSLLHWCVSDCDRQRREYADNSTNKCVGTCPTLPDLFADNTTYTCVSACPITPSVGYNCTNACPLGTWACNVTRECKAACTQGAAIQTQFADNYTGRCVQYCPRNLFTYADMLTKSCVAVCPDAQITANVTTYPRTFADDSTKTCVAACPANPQTYAENTTRTCVFECPINSFGENNTRQCVQSCTFWRTFADNSTTFCVSNCPQDSFADSSSMRCVARCPPGTFADNSTWRCVVICPSNPALYGDTTSQVCVINCPNNFYGDDISRQCVAVCPKSPVIAYAYQPTHRCYKDCLFPFFGQPKSNTITYGTCQTYCYTGQYANMTTHRCEDCKLECMQCVSLLGCQSCINNFYLFNGTCLTGCQSGTGSSCKSACPFNKITQTITYADAVSKSCVEICPITTTGGSFGFNLTLYCLQRCPINYYASNVTRRCELCTDGCNNCTSPSVCFSCYPGYIFSRGLCVKQCSVTLPFYYGSTCLPSCIDTTYLMTDLVTCGACSTTCMTCSMIASNCTRCKGGYLYNYNCVTSCPNNYYPDFNMTCQPCTATATQCNTAPLTYSLQSFNTNGRLYAMLTFSRPVSMNTAQIKKIVSLNINGVAPTDYDWSATPTEDPAVYRLDIFMKTSNNQMALTFTYQNPSLNQLSLGLTFINPSLVQDSAGGVLASTTAQAALPRYDYISPDVQAATQSAAGFAKTLSFVALSVMVLLMFRGSYAMMVACEVFQMIQYHYFLAIELPYNFSNFLIGLKAFNFEFFPNMLKSSVPEDYKTPDMPTYYSLMVPDTAFFASSGHYIMIIVLYIAWALIISFLKNKGINKWRSLRKYCKGVFERRIRFGAVHECLWVCYISFVFFGLLQLKNLKVYGSWSYGNIVLSIACWLFCVLLSGWVIFLALKYKEDMTKVPKKHAFILGEDSHIPFELPLRHVRKLLFCIFLVMPYFQMQIIAMIANNVLVLSYYLFFKPSKSRFSNWINILIELSYIALEIIMLLFNNELSLTTEKKLTYGTAMMGLSVCALLLAVVWLVWQFMLFLYEFKFVRDIIEETKLANQIHPEEDNLKIELDRQYQKDEIVQESVISEGAAPRYDEETIDGIEKQYNQVVHYTDDKPKAAANKRAEAPLQSNFSSVSDSNEPRLISSRASSRMLFADLNVEDME